MKMDNYIIRKLSCLCVSSLKQMWVFVIKLKGHYLLSIESYEPDVTPRRSQPHSTMCP